MVFDNTPEFFANSMAGKSETDRALTEVVKEDSELTLLSGCFCTNSRDFFQYDIGTKQVGGACQQVYFLNEVSASDQHLVAFLRGELDEYSSQAYSLAVRYMLPQTRNRSVTRSVYCGLPQSLDIADGSRLSPFLGNNHDRIYLEPGDFPSYKLHETDGFGPEYPKLKIESAEVADNLTLIKISTGPYYNKMLLFGKENGVRVALTDESIPLPDGSIEHLAKALFHANGTVLRRQITGEMVIAPAEIIQKARESKKLGVLTTDVTLLPQLSSFERHGDTVLLQYQYGEERFTIHGTIEQRGNQFVFVSEGPKTTDKESEYWLHNTVIDTLKVKLPNLGLVALDYRGSQPVRSLLPKLKSFEQLSPEEFMVIFENAGTPFPFHIERSTSCDSSLVITGRSMGTLADNWARMKIASIFSSERPYLPYNGAMFIGC